MDKKNLRRVSMLVTAQTAKNLERLAQMDGQASVGRAVDKLVREKMVSLHRLALWPQNHITQLFERCLDAEDEK